MAKHTTSDIAKRLNIHVNTVRKWTTDYAEYLSDSAQRKYKKYSHDDTVVLATIAKYREQGFAPETIKKLLAKGERVDTLPRLPTVEEVKAREGIELIPKPELDNALNEIMKLERQLETVIKNRNEELEILRNERDAIADKASETVEKLNARIVILERELGEAKGRYDMLSNEQIRTSRLIVWLVALVAVISLSLVVMLVVLMLTR